MQANRFLVNLSRAAFAAALTLSGAAAMAHDGTADGPLDFLRNRPDDAEEQISFEPPKRKKPAPPGAPPAVAAHRAPDKRPTTSDQK